MLYFANDYTEGACKEILDAFIRTDDENHTVIRFATSWATKKEDVEKLMDLL